MIVINLKNNYSLEFYQFVFKINTNNEYKKLFAIKAI